MLLAAARFLAITGRRPAIGGPFAMSDTNPTPRWPRAAGSEVPE